MRLQNAQHGEVKITDVAITVLKLNIIVKMNGDFFLTFCLNIFYFYKLKYYWVELKCNIALCGLLCIPLMYGMSEINILILSYLILLNMSGVNKA